MYSSKDSSSAIPLCTTPMTSNVRNSDNLTSNPVEDKSHDNSRSNSRHDNAARSNNKIRNNTLEEAQEQEYLEQHYLQGQMQEQVLPHILAVLSPIILEKNEQIQYWKQKYQKAILKLQHLQQQRTPMCPTCQKENREISTATTSKKRKHFTHDTSSSGTSKLKGGIKSIVASAAACATRRKQSGDSIAMTNLASTYRDAHTTPRNETTKLESDRNVDNSRKVKEDGKIVKNSPTSSSSSSGIIATNTLNVALTDFAVTSSKGSCRNVDESCGGHIATTSNIASPQQQQQQQQQRQQQEERQEQHNLYSLTMRRPVRPYKSSDAKRQPSTKGRASGAHDIQGLEQARRPQIGKNEPQFKYVEVVRNRQERRSLKGHTCPECDAFAKFLLQSRDRDGNLVFDPKDIIQECSRHRSRFTQMNCTPEGFWELSFTDSIAARNDNGNEGIVEEMDDETTENV